MANFFDGAKKAEGQQRWKSGKIVEKFRKRRIKRLDVGPNWGKISLYAPIFSRFLFDFAGRGDFNVRQRTPRRRTARRPKVSANGEKAAQGEARKRFSGGPIVNKDKIAVGAFASARFKQRYFNGLRAETARRRAFDGEKRRRTPDRLGVSTLGGASNDVAFFGRRKSPG